MANELVDVMREFGVEVRLLGTEEEPSPGGLAMADMLMEILRLRQLTSNLAYDAMGQPLPQGETRTASTYVSPYVGTVESTPSTFRMALREPAQPADAGGEDVLIDHIAHDCLVSASVVRLVTAKAVELGLVPRREVVVTDADVEVARRMFVDASQSGEPIPSTRVLRAVLDAFAVRQNERIAR